MEHRGLSVDRDQLWIACQSHRQMDAVHESTFRTKSLLQRHSCRKQRFDCILWRLDLRDAVAPGRCVRTRRCSNSERDRKSLNEILSLPSVHVLILGPTRFDNDQLVAVQVWFCRLTQLPLKRCEERTKLEHMAPNDRGVRVD